MKRKKKLHAKCYDKGWEYVPAVQTDIRATFAKVRADLAKADKEQTAKIAGEIHNRRKVA